MSNITLDIQGLEVAREILKELPDKFQKRAVIRMYRRAVRPVVRAAKAGVPQSKTVQQSIKAFEPRGSRKNENPVLFVGPKFNRNRDKDPWFAHMIEGGTQGTGKFGGKYGARSRAAQDSKNDIFRFINANRKGQQRYRRDQQAKPFMRPAVDGNIGSVRDAVTKDMIEHLQREAKKLRKNI